MGSIRTTIAVAALLALGALTAPGLAAVPAPDAPDPVGEAVRSATLADTQAILALDHDDLDGFALVSRAELLIRRGGRAVYVDAPATVVDTELRADALPAVTVADVDADGEPDVLVDTYSGGAHCCSATVLYRWDSAAATFVPLVHEWGNPGYRLRGDATGPILVTRDDRFAYRFTAYAFSNMPVRVWRLRDGKLVDVTRSQRARVEADARTQLASYRFAVREGYPTRGALAAYVADLHLLGRAKAADEMIARAVRQGTLRDELASGVPAYVRSLRGFLKAAGYTR